MTLLALPRKLSVVKTCRYTLLLVTIYPPSVLSLDAGRSKPFRTLGQCAASWRTVYRRLVLPGHPTQTYRSEAMRLAAPAEAFSVELVVKRKIRIGRYTWRINLYVVKGIICPLTLGAHFLRSTGLLMDVLEGLVFFASTRLKSCRSLSTSLLRNLIYCVLLWTPGQTCPI
jgi:hypothetical protein